MEERTEWMRNMFNALTSKSISRNKNFNLFTSGWPRKVFYRFRTVCALQKEAERLAQIPGSRCWVEHRGEKLDFHLSCPSLLYERTVPLSSYEWDWLGRQEGIQALLTSDSLEGGTAT